MTKASNFDQFYTQDRIAKQCVEIVGKIFNLNDYKCLEPSAGAGAFIKYLPDYFACDIEPASSGIVKCDFLNTDITGYLNDKPILTIGNPPFGKRAKTAIEFINKAFEYSRVVAFILPIQFLKYSAQKCINSEAKLIYNELLPPNSFLFNGKEYSVRCCFQIWSLDEVEGYDNQRLINTPITKHNDFEMWQYNNTIGALKYFDKSIYNWDFAVPRQGYKDYNIKETDPSKMDRKTQWIFFKATNKEVLEKLLKLDFDKLSKNNTSTPGFGKADVIKEYERIDQ